MSHKFGISDNTVLRNLGSLLKKIKVNLVKTYSKTNLKDIEKVKSRSLNIWQHCQAISRLK